MRGGSAGATGKTLLSLLVLVSNSENIREVAAWVVTPLSIIVRVEIPGFTLEQNCFAQTPNARMLP